MTTHFLLTQHDLNALTALCQCRMLCGSPSWRFVHRGHDRLCIVERWFCWRLVQQYRQSCPAELVWLAQRYAPGGLQP